jgi:hypothetical protein
MRCCGSFDFGVLAEESNESDSILKHDVVLLFCSGCLSGHPKASGAAPQDKVCFFGGPRRRQPLRKTVGEPKHGGPRMRKQKTAAPPGAGMPAVKRRCARETKGRIQGTAMPADRVRRMECSGQTARRQPVAIVRGVEVETPGSKDRWIGCQLEDECDCRWRGLVAESLGTDLRLSGHDR